MPPPSTTRGGNDPASRPVTDLLQAVEVRGAFSLSVSARSRGADKPAEIEAKEDDILEVEVDGFRLWTSVGRYRDEQRIFNPTSVGDGVVDVSGLVRPSETERGLREWAASAVSLLRLGRDRIADEVRDPKTIEEFLKDSGLEVGTAMGAWLATKLLIWAIERQLRPREGLYPWASAIEPLTDGAPDPSPASFDGVDLTKPLLVFIHGTASSTRGSFGGFVTPAPTPEWKSLVETFENRIYAFEHRTLNRSPIENALALATALPSGATISLVSHSRGGMVGDLLSVAGFSPAEIKDYRRVPARGTDDEGGADFQDADEHDREGLRALTRVLDQKKLRIARFARCASPARGTLLASENSDEFLSILTTLVGLIPGIGQSPLYEVVKRITLETAKNRWRPELLPGIEAMIPSSPLVRLLNRATAGARGDLGVVAGDIEGGNLLKRLATFVTDRFIYESRDNDLVVNTDSMFHGARRDLTRYVFDQGSDVSHFNYFRSARTRDAVTRWTTSPVGAIPAGFKDLGEGEAAPVPMARSIASRGGGNKPVVIVVPDLLGTSLVTPGGTTAWPDVDWLASGGLDTLADVAKGRLTPGLPLDEVYGDLCAQLVSSYDVVPIGYDWRQSVEAGATRLAKALAAVPSSASVRILAHGVGGLLVRYFAATRPAEWQALRDRSNLRVVLLGSPHRGTFESVRMIVGTHPVVQQLAMLDGGRSARDVGTMFGRFPGVLEVLPRGTKNEKKKELGFLNPAVWTRLTDSSGAKTVPSSDDLAAAARIAQVFEAEMPAADRVISVVGTAPTTVDGVESRAGALVFHVTSEGDGSVTHESGTLSGSALWYADASHGDLVADVSTIGAIIDLLEQATTTQLSRSAPAASRGGTSLRNVRAEPVLYPTRADLALASIGRRAPARYRRERGGFSVSVVHTDLRFARFPIVVGHYEGDTIIGAEAAVDAMLDGALQQRYKLGIYPGAYGEVEVVRRRPTEVQRALQLPNAAIVVGLGRMGALTSGQVAHLVRTAALKYLMQLADDAFRDAPAGASERSTALLGLSVLLIGSFSSVSISVDDSVAAILRGVAQANAEIDAQADGVVRRIEQVEIVELFLDSAIQASRAARVLATRIGEELGVRIEAAPLLHRGRLGRTRLTAPNVTDAWRRWEITAESIDPPARTHLAPALRDRLKASLAAGEGLTASLAAALTDAAFPDVEGPEPPRRLRFVSLSDRARAEVLMQDRQLALIDRLVAASVTDSRYRPDHARALFELMIPNDLKDGLAQLSRVVLVVDGDTAAYPWELMSDGGAQPLCVRVGMVRQLETGQFRPEIRATTSHAAFVVGDPHVDPPTPQLAGARQEAALVAELLRNASRPFDVVLRNEHPTALDVMAGLFDRPYRVLHLAGHGEHQDPRSGGAQARSGMVLDNGLFLSAVEVANMRQVPDLVFLNCCFIGQTGPEPVKTTRDVRYNRLAASLSRELIQMGVRAVVACGWAVRDDAALEFAKTFYEHMLRGETFGRALLEARQRTFARFGDANTWGAYQAYGDPDFRLVDSGRHYGPGDSRVAPEEMIDVLKRARETAADTQRGHDDPKDAVSQQTKRLDRLVAEMPREWLSRSDVLEALGRAYGELEQYETAAQRLQQALDTGELDAATTIKAVEQLANFEARAGAVLAKRDLSAGREAIRTAIRRLDRLQELALTSERFNLLGGAYKRLAGLCSTSELSEKRKLLETSLRCYRSAHDHNTSRGVVDPYPIINWLGLAAALGAPVRETVSLVAEAEATAAARFGHARDPFDAVFDAVAIPDLAVVRALATGSLTADGAEVDRIVALYQDVFRRVSASARQIESAIGQLQSLAGILDGRADGEAAALALRRIRARLTGQPDPEHPGRTTKRSSGKRPAPNARRRRRRPLHTKKRPTS